MIGVKYVGSAEAFPGGNARRNSFVAEVYDVSSAGVDTEKRVRQFVEGLTSQERMLVVLKRELYEGDWQEMLADLHARLQGGPYIFKLAHRISDDLERIEKLREFEDAHGVDLSDYVETEA